MDNFQVPQEASRIAPRYLTRHTSQMHQISCLLHDELSQSMTALRLQLALFEIAPDNKGSENQLHLQTSIAMVEGMIEDLRKVSHMLYPTALDAGSIGQAISDACQQAADQTNIVITYREGYEDTLPNFLQVLLYRFTQEMVRILTRFEGMQHISVCLEQDAEKVVLSIQALHQPRSDEISQNSIIKSNPVIEDIEDEIKLLGGSFQVKAETDQVTYLYVVIPFPEDL